MVALAKKGLSQLVELKKRLLQVLTIVPILSPGAYLFIGYYMLLHVITCYYQLLYPFSAAQVAPQVSMLAPIPGPVTLPSTPPAGRSPPCHHSAGQ